MVKYNSSGTKAVDSSGTSFWRSRMGARLIKTSITGWTTGELEDWMGILVRDRDLFVVKYNSGDEAVVQFGISASFGVATNSSKVYMTGYTWRTGWETHQ